MRRKNGGHSLVEEGRGAASVGGGGARSEVGGFPVRAGTEDGGL